MAATKTKRRTRRKDPAPATGATRYHGLDQDGNDLFPPFAERGPALSKTITYASRTPEEQTYYVSRWTLFGDPVDLFAIKRDEHGGIQIITLTTED